MGMSLCFNTEKQISEYLCENYQKHCISGNWVGYEDTDLLNTVPIKIFEMVYHLQDDLDGKRYSSSVEHMSVHMGGPQIDPMDSGWDRYREYFDQCTNLKEIEISIAEHDIPIREYLPNFSRNTKKFGKNVFLIFKN